MWRQGGRMKKGTCRLTSHHNRCRHLLLQQRRIRILKLLSPVKMTATSSRVPLSKNHGESCKVPIFSKILCVFFLFSISFVSMPNKYDSFDREDLVSLTNGNVRTDATILCMCPDIKDTHVSNTMHVIFFVL